MELVEELLLARGVGKAFLGEVEVASSVGGGADLVHHWQALAGLRGATGDDSAVVVFGVGGAVADRAFNEGESSF